MYVDPYHELDLSLGYQFSESLSATFDCINLTGENVRSHGRAEREVWFLEDDAARYSLGVHYKLQR